MSWSIVRLGDVADVQLGKMLSPKAQGSGRPARYLRNSNVQWGTINFSDLLTMDFSKHEREKFSLRRGDLLVCEGGEPGRCAVVAEDLADIFFQKALMRVRPRAGELDTRFLQRFMEHAALRGTFLRGGNQATIAHFPAVKLNALEVPLPAVHEQRRIADILDKADAIRRKRKEAIALTEELLRSAFLEMFGDPVTNPKGWPVCAVGDVVSEVRDGPHVSPHYAEKGIPFLSTRNIRPGRLLLDDLRYVSQEGYEELTRRFRPRVGDVLLTKGGTTGLAKVVDFDWPFAVWVHLAVLRPRGNIRPEFLESALNSEYGYKQSQHFTRGIANRDLGLTRIVQIKFPLPPLDVQDRYVDFARRLRGYQTRQEEALSSADALFASLLYRAFRGELTGSVFPKK